MFDVGRALALLWALFLTGRARAWPEVGSLCAAAYVLGLEVASGVTIRGQGVMDPMLAVLLGLLGPTALPRGPLPPLPLAAQVVAWPAAVDVVVAASLLALSRWRIRSLDALPPLATGTLRYGRAAVALSLLAVFDGFAAIVRALPDLLLRDI